MVKPVGMATAAWTKPVSADQPSSVVGGTVNKSDSTIQFLYTRIVFQQRIFEFISNKPVDHLEDKMFGLDQAALYYDTPLVVVQGMLLPSANFTENEGYRDLTLI